MQDNKLLKFSNSSTIDCANCRIFNILTTEQNIRAGSKVMEISFEGVKEIGQYLVKVGHLIQRYFFFHFNRKSHCTLHLVD